MSDLWDKDARERARSEILTEIAQRTGVPVELILSRSREQRVVAARRRVIWELHERGWSSVAIGRAIGRDHVTVLFALGRIGGRAA